jgi:hypothetical protein
MYSIIRNNIPTVLDYGPFQDEQGISHPANILTLWDNDELASIGVYRVIDAPIPADKITTGWSLSFDGLNVIRTFSIADRPPPQPPTLDQYRDAIQVHIDSVAKSKDYRDGFALAGYVSSTIPQWKAEAETFIAWRDAVWIAAYTLLDQHDPTNPPSIDDVIAALPGIVWPQED